MLNVSEIRDLFLLEYREERFITDKTGVKCLEILGTSFVADENTIFGKVSEKYIKKELEWYLSQSLKVEDMGDPPTIWRQIASDKGYINSNYGWCIFSSDNKDQFMSVRKTLLNDKNSRRATMVYTRPNIQTEYNKDNMSDFICTNAVNYFIRDNKLHCVVQMRSNDIFSGYRNDYAWHKYVLGLLANELKEEKYNELEEGDIIWNAASLHMYEKQFGLIRKYIKTGKHT